MPIANSTAVEAGPPPATRRRAWRLPVRLCLLAVLACVAPALALVTWPIGDAPSAVRTFSLPVPLAEILILALAVRDGFVFRDAFARLSHSARLFGWAWLFFALLSALSARSAPTLALMLFATTALHALVGLAVYDRVVARWCAWQDEIYLALAAGTAAYLCVAAACVWSVWGQPGFAWDGFGAGVSNVRQIGFYGLTLVGLAAGLVASGSRTASLSVLGSLLLAGWFLVEWSGGRASFGAAIIATAVLIALGKGRRLQVAGLSLVCCLAAAPLSDAAAPSPLWGAHAIVDGPTDPADLAAFTSSRTVIWTETLTRIGERPFIGHGEGQFRLEVASAQAGLNQPHNALLQVLYQWGLLGSAALALALSAPAVRTWKAGLPALRPALPAVGVVGGLGAASMLDGALFYHFPVMMAAIALALVFAATATTQARPAALRR